MPRINLKVLRVKNGLTQTAFAEKLGYTRPAYAAIENGLTAGTMKFWEALQEAFHIDDSEMWELMKIDKE